MLAQRVWTVPKPLDSDLALLLSAYFSKSWARGTRQGCATGDGLHPHTLGVLRTTQRRRQGHATSYGRDPPHPSSSGWPPQRGHLAGPCSPLRAAPKARARRNPVVHHPESLALDEVADASGAVHPLEPMGYLCLQAVISDTPISKRSTGALVGCRPSVGSPDRTPTRWEAGKKWMKRQQDGMAVDHHAHHPARGAAPVPFGLARAKHLGGAGRPRAACPRAVSACAP